jgi:hypothetical protein
VKLKTMQDAAQHNPNISNKTTNKIIKQIKIKKPKPSLNNHVTLTTNTKNILNRTN